jgi:hypothetical protein
MSSTIFPPLPIPDYSVLYKSKSKGKITKWEIKIEPITDSTQIISKYNIVVTFGEIDGKQQTHITTIEKGKSNRSIYQQAVLEANSKWNEKKNRDGYTDVEPERLPLPSGVFSGAFSPMLANTFNIKLYALPSITTTVTTGIGATATPPVRGYKIPFPAFVQRKYDGIRCIAYLDPIGNVILESRKGVRFTQFTNIEFGLKLFFEQAGGYIGNEGGELSPPARFYFDGELYSNSIPFETINGCVRLTKNITAEDRTNINKIQYHIYDCFNGKRPNLVFKERIAILKNVFDGVRKEDDTRRILNIIREVETEEVFGIEDVKLKHAQYVENGFEGIMIRDPEGVYEPNKRSKYLQKYKEFMEEEFKIVGFHDGEGVDRELVIWDCITKEGKPFSVRPRTTFEERKRLFKDASQYLGKQLTVVFQEYSPDMIPRFPVGKAIREIV